ncbi:gliding motility-associated C-terminal domain-containing protein [Fluviicola sp.]|uniref:gliding motility-associated C-terminal domain-containing protein n=1 Tax=Fluviicola sp. TaxID=1917219 RepID=UPI0031D7500F
MLLKQILYILTILIGFHCSSQNLVKNGSFEILNNCPVNQGSVTITYATDWMIPLNGIMGSPDLFAPCAPNTNMQVPNNFAGHQFPQEGAVYAGLIEYAYDPSINDDNAREYMCKELECSLKQGHQYYVGFYTSVGDKAAYSINEIGLKFFDSRPTQILQSNPDVELLISNSTIKDTVNWILVSDTITANGTEKFLSIGCYLTDDDATVEMFNPQALMKRAYFYIDNVFVIPLDTADYKPQMEILGADKFLCPLDSYQYDFSTTATDVIWQNAVEATVFTVSDTGQYIVEAYINGCKYQDTVIFSAADLSQDMCESLIEFPNIFTPNGDKVNDLLVPVKLRLITNARLSIYNRWGNLIYETQDMETGWNGVVDDKPAVEGVYFWRIEAENSLNSSDLHASGFFQLIRD